MKHLLTATLALAWTALTYGFSSKGAVTLPVNVIHNFDNLNSESLTKRYLMKRAAVSSSPLTNIHNDVTYTMPLGLGTPAQNFNVIIDTGSHITWVVSKTCQSAACASPKKFDCAASSSCRDLRAPFNVSYVSGEGVSGAFVAEHYTLGDLSFNAVAGIATTNGASLNPTVDGIMGLWYFAGRADVPILNILQNTTALTNNVIGVYLQTSEVQPAPKTSPGGQITFGGVDTSKFSGDITYINCVGDRSWTIPFGNIKIGNGTLTGQGVMATIDTGTTAMLMSEEASSALNSLIPGSALATRAGAGGTIWVIPCKGDVPISISFGTFTAKIPYSSFALQNTRFLDDMNQEYCVSAAMHPSGQVTQIDDWLIGDVFLKHVYSVFDFSTNAQTGGRVGFAQLGTGGNGGTFAVAAGDGVAGGGGGNGGQNGSGGQSGKGGNGSNSATGGMSSSKVWPLVAGMAAVGAAALL